MKRIGVVASKMSKGNLAVYNGYVVLISFLFSLFFFIVAGASVIFALAVMAYFGNEVMGFSQERIWSSILTVCMVSLSIVIGLFNICAISMNLRLTQGKKS